MKVHSVKSKAMILEITKKEWLRVSEALGILVADSTEGTRHHLWDKGLMLQWDDAWQARKKNVRKRV